MRLFIAFDVDEVILDKVQLVVNKLESFSSSKDIKFVSPKIMHITIKFIGDYKKEKLTGLIEKLKTIKFLPINLIVKGLGSFGPISKTRVLWAGIKESVENKTSLLELGKSIDKELSELGIEPEKRDFTPHLTLARVKTKVNEKVIDFFNKNKDLDFGSFTLNEFTLYESILKPPGPEYKMIENFSHSN